MRLADIPVMRNLEKKLNSFKQPLPGINSKAEMHCFVRQIVDSIRRIQYVTAIRDKKITATCADPYNDGFNPLRAASWHRQEGNFDESVWLLFLSVHFGKAKISGWHLVREVYKGSSKTAMWSWENVSMNPKGFRQWLHANQAQLKAAGNFGNHRKYESLNANRKTGTGEAVESYVAWIGTKRSHQSFFDNILAQTNGNPRDAFDALYKSMQAVRRFGRTARFDYLTMVGKFKLAAIEPGSTYMQGATGPLTGAKLLFGGSKIAKISASQLHLHLIALEKHLDLYFGMQVLEDALCNWQKSPKDYVYFGG